MKKLTKKELYNYLEGNLQSVAKLKDEELLSMVKVILDEYDDRESGVTKSELVELAEEVEKRLPTPLEASAKESDSVVSKTTLKPVSDKPKAEKPKVDKPKAEKPKVDKEDSVKVLELASQFPTTLKVGDKELAINMDVSSFDDIEKLQSQGKEVALAMFWNKRHLKQFKYDINDILDFEVKDFPQDLDTTIPVFLSESGNVMYTISVSTDIMYTILPDDLEVIDGMRLSRGVEFNIYTSK